MPRSRITRLYHITQQATSEPDKEGNYCTPEKLQELAHVSQGCPSVRLDLEVLNEEAWNIELDKRDY